MSIFEKREGFSIVIDEKDVTKAIRIIKRNNKYLPIEANNCGWAKYKEKWFIMFNLKHKEFDKILNEISEIAYEIRVNGKTYYRREKNETN